MIRLSRAQQQQRTRMAVLRAAREEFTERGYVEAKVDRIAERAELTRGAVYSNFPSKRALYLAVLVDLVERSSTETVPPSAPASQATQAVQPTQALQPSQAFPGSTGAALGAFARVWLERLPLADDTPAGGHLQLRSLAGVLDDEPARTAFAQATRFEALLLGLALEAHRPPPVGPARSVRLAELVLTLLNGVAGFAERSSGFGDPFDVALACEHLAGIALADSWNPPYLSYVSPAQPTNEAWTPPPELPDQLTGRPVALGADGVIAVLGTSRLAAAEEAVRAAHPGEAVTVVVVTSDPAEIGRLVRLRVGDLVGCLRRVFAVDAWPPLRLVFDDHAAVAPALGLAGGDATEAAVRIQGGAIVARAQGRGAAYAAATVSAPDASRLHRRET